MELDTRWERSEDALRRCAACGEVFAPPMHMHHLRFRHGPAYGAQRRLYVNERAEPHPARAPVYRQEPAVTGSMLTRLAHLHGATETEGRRV
jgi:hypothetical protein